MLFRPLGKVTTGRDGRTMKESGVGEDATNEIIKGRYGMLA
jgi:hypothetical protein